MTAAASELPPSVARRFAAFLYEGVLLFGVIFFSALVYGALTGQRHALQGRVGLGLLVVAVLGVYFVGFWTHGGQTLAMKTWHLRLRAASGDDVTWSQAAWRFGLAWLWFVPALLTASVLDIHGAASIGCLLAGVAAYLLLARLHPQRLFLHDVLSATRVVTQLPART